MDILNLDRPLRTADPLVQVQTGLGAGVYIVDLLIADAAGEQARAQIAFEITGRIIPPPTDVHPVVDPVVSPVIRPVITPVTPVAPIPRAPIKRPAVKKTKPPAEPIE